MQAVAKAILHTAFMFRKDNGPNSAFNYKPAMSFKPVAILQCKCLTQPHQTNTVL